MRAFVNAPSVRTRTWCPRSDRARPPSASIARAVSPAATCSPVEAIASISRALGKLTQLEIFRCQSFGSEGVLALKGRPLTRLTLRDLPNVDDRALEVFDDLPKLKRLYLHEITSAGDSGLAHLGALKSLELLDIWTIPQMSDATVDVIATLPNLKELTIRSTGVSDASIDKLLALPSLQSLTFKENGSVTSEGLKKLASKKWSKLDIGASGSTDDAAP